MTTEEFRQWYNRLGLKQADLARRLDTTQATISRWLDDGPKGRKPPGHLRLALERLEEILIEERREAERPPRRRRAVRSEQPPQETTDA